ncbi:MAG: hypothetical protein OEQ18_00010 [Gammaproteobacteria bacterium]|nr:hypothetical protein [Gammaproteobacteria bacterium]
MRITQLNDHTFVVNTNASGGTQEFSVRDVGANASPRYDRNLGQFVEITSIAASTNVGFQPPLIYTYSAALDPEANCQQNTSRLVGFEDFTIKHTTNGGTQFYMGNTYGCWWSNVEFNVINRYGIEMYASLWPEIRRCKFHNFGVDGRGRDRAYGAYIRLTSNALVVDNIFTNLRVACFLEGGSQGSVFAYNYTRYNQDDESDQGPVSIGTSHGAHPMYNLVEGNKADNTKADFSWGSGSHITYFRNNFHGYNDGLSSENRKCIHISSHNWSNNVVGNVLGSTNFSSWVYQPKVNGFANTNVVIYILGYPNTGNWSWSTNNWYSDYDVEVTNTLLRHGNYDYANNDILWDAGIADTNLPDSYYLAAKPDWWDFSPWPPFNPEGATESARIGTIPAENRANGITRWWDSWDPGASGMRIRAQ